MKIFGAKGSSGPKFLLGVAFLWSQHLFGFFLFSSSWGDGLGASAMPRNKPKCCGNTSLASLCSGGSRPLLCPLHISADLRLRAAPWALAEQSACTLV